MKDNCPYNALPPSAFWRTGSVGYAEAADGTQQLNEIGILDPDTAVASAGSCFAQHIARHLKEKNYNFLDAERAPADLDTAAAQARGYDLFSARYGNIYTAGQLDQLIGRATGEFSPDQDAWFDGGRWYDPFRPAIEPGGFGTLERLQQEMTSHLEKVRKLFSELDVFVFTLGLTEAWRAKSDGTIFATCPGCSVGKFNPDDHEFVNFTVQDVVRHLVSFFERLSRLNPSAQVILTVSPVPLAATYSGRNVVEATVYSKSVLRAAVEEVRNKYTNCHYFASYEMVTDPRKSRSFAEDGRTVAPEAVNTVMNAFFKQFAVSEPKGLQGLTVSEGPIEADVICDEEMIAEAIARNNAGGHTGTEELPFGTQAQTIYVLGDSHTLPLRDVFFKREGEETPITIKTEYIEGFSASDMVGADGGLGTQLVDRLKSLSLLKEDGKAIWRAPNSSAQNLLYASGQPAVPPVLLVSCGDIDLRGTVFRQFNVSFEIAPVEENVRTSGSKLPVSEMETRALFKGLFEPLVQGMVALQNVGLTRSYLSMIPPVSLEDEKVFRQLHGFDCPLSLRQKLTALANQVLGDMCAQAGIAFVDVTPDVTENGLLAKTVRLDGIHMSTGGGMKLIAKAIDHATDNSAPHFNADLYEKARVSAVTGDTKNTSAHSTARREFLENGLIQRQVDIQRVESTVGNMSFSQDVGNRHQRLTWCGNPRSPFNTTMRTLQPNEDLLREVYNVVYSEENRPFFQACVGSDYVFFNTRFYLSQPHESEPVGPQTYHHDGCPPGVIRALIYLSDVGPQDGPFEYVDSEGHSNFAVGPKGSLLIFDANRLLHRGSPPISGERRVIDFCVAPRLRGRQRQVLWAGMNNWPMDPFQIQVEGMCAWPPLSGNWQRTNSVS